MEELKRRMLRGLAVLQAAGLSVWNRFYRWLNRHWFGLTLGLILGAWFF